MKNVSFSINYPLFLTYTYYDFQVDATSEINTSVGF